MNELALFAGAGGGLLASKLLRWNTVCAVEISKYPRDILLKRQEDGYLENFPIWDDVTTFNGHPWRGKVNIITGGFPCQDISSAGTGEGLTGKRSGLWSEYRRIIDEVRPEMVFAENSPQLRTRGLGQILSELDCLGYDSAWGVLGAGDLGFKHDRKRMWIVANSRLHGYVRNVAQERGFRLSRGEWSYEEEVKGWSNRWDGVGAIVRGYNGLPDSSRTVRKLHGVANRLDRLKAIGNGQVPAVASTAFNMLATALIKSRMRSTPGVEPNVTTSYAMSV